MNEEAEYFKRNNYLKFLTCRSANGCKQSYKPETKQLDRIDCNADPKLSHHNFDLMQILVEVSLLFYFLEISKPMHNY